MTLTTEEEQWVKEQVKEYNKWKQAKALDNLDLTPEERMIEFKKIYPEKDFDVIL